MIKDFGESTAPAPECYTGLKDTNESPPYFRARLDTASFVGRGIRKKELLHRMRQIAGLEFDFASSKQAARGKVYAECVYGVLGCTLSLNPDPYADTCEYRVSLSGKFLASLPEHSLYVLLSWLWSNGAKCTRWDWAIDDYLRVLTLAEYELMADEECYYGARSSMLYSSKRKRVRAHANTIYIGSWGGEQMLCIYDKQIESKGAINAIRLEYRFFDKKADYFFQKYATCNDDVLRSKIQCGMALARIGFTPPEGRTKHVTRLCRIWIELCDSIADRVKTTFPKEPSTITDKEEWIEHKVVPSMCAIIAYHGWIKFWKWLRRLISHQLAKLSPKQAIEHRFLKRWKRWAEKGGMMPEYNFSATDLRCYNSG